jgi:competence protein ComEC
MIRWIPYTFVRFLVFFISGILLAIYLPDFLPEKASIFILAVLAFIYFLLYGLKSKINVPISVFGLIALPALFLAGHVHLIERTEIHQPDHFANVSQSADAFEVVLTSFAEEKENSWKVTGEVSQIHDEGWKSCHGKVLLYFRKTDFSTSFNYGDVLLIHNAPREVIAPMNPGEFDYKRFLSFKNIYHQSFVSKAEVVFLRHNPPNLLMDYAITARLWANRVLKQYVKGEREQGVASALILGVTDGLDNDLLNAYAATGAMHVLAVSGLHISIIYGIILWLLRPLTKTEKGKWIVAVVSLIVLWLYAFVTGLSPSVLRAVVMFSFVAIARATSRNTNIYNTLAASCFCLLVYDPYMVMSVGFQLSYIAVFGIVYIQPMLIPLWKPRTWLMNEVWNMTCVTIAAQIATFALGLLYFHQFPNYFLLSNLLVIPISFFVLVGGLILLAVSFVSLLSSWVGFVLTMFIKLLNLVVVVIEQFPFSLTEEIQITTLQCWLLIGISVCIILMIQFKKFSYLLPASAFAVMFTFIQWQQIFEIKGQTKLAVYRVPGHHAVDFIQRGKAFTSIDSALAFDAQKIKFHIRPNRIQSGISAIHPFTDLCTLSAHGVTVVHWEGRVIVNIQDPEFSIPFGVTPDLVIISNNAVADLSKVKHSPSARFILDSSNSFKYSSQMLRKASTSNIDVYSVLHRGAFILDFKS